MPEQHPHPRFLFLLHCSLLCYPNMISHTWGIFELRDFTIWGKEKLTERDRNWTQNAWYQNLLPFLVIKGKGCLWQKKVNQQECRKAVGKREGEGTFPENRDMSVLLTALASAAAQCLAHHRCSMNICGGRMKERKERKYVGYYLMAFLCWGHGFYNHFCQLRLFSFKFLGVFWRGGVSFYGYFFFHFEVFLLFKLKRLGLPEV